MNDLTPTRDLLALLPMAEVDTWQEPVHLPDTDTDGPLKWYWMFDLTRGLPDGEVITTGKGSPEWVCSFGPYDSQEQAYNAGKRAKENILAGKPFTVMVGQEIAKEWLGLPTEAKKLPPEPGRTPRATSVPLNEVLPKK